MASKVMASRSQPNPDPPRQPPSSSLNTNTDHTRGLGSMNMDDLFRNIYPDSDSFNQSAPSAVEVGMRNGTGNKSAEEVWRDIVTGGAGTGSAPGSGTGEPAMTLEDFLTKAGAVNEEDVRVPAVPSAFGGLETAAMMNPAPGVPAIQFTPSVCVQNGYSVEIGNGISATAAGSGRGKRRAAVEEAQLDKATQQKQRRMIKNRESAARSRERKQAYTVELESLVTQLEEDNARLVEEEAKLNKLRHKQLMENLIPVIEKRGPRRVLRRVRSMEW